MEHISDKRTREKYCIDCSVMPYMARAVLTGISHAKNASAAKQDWDGAKLSAKCCAASSKCNAASVDAPQMPAVRLDRNPQGGRIMPGRPAGGGRLAAHPPHQTSAGRRSHRCADGKTGSACLHLAAPNWNDDDGGHRWTELTPRHRRDRCRERKKRERAKRRIAGRYWERPRRAGGWPRRALLCSWCTAAAPTVALS